MTPAGRLGRVAWRYPAPLVPGRLIQRYKRFLADVELAEGEVVTAHCPNSGSMLGCREPGAAVYLSHHPEPGRRTAYTWEMIQAPAGWVGVNTGLPNRLVVEAARRRALPPFCDAVAVRPEVRLGPGVRLDLLVERESGPLYVEVKNVTLVQGELALFPDAITERGSKHLLELTALAGRGLGAAMVYVVQHPAARAMAPAREIDPRYAGLLAAALAAGVQAWVVQARVSPDEVRLERLLPLKVEA